jgi:putative DNA primase/helicase
MKTQDAVKNREWEILHHYGFQKTNNRHIDCKLCESKKSFRLSEYQGKPAYICKCSNGDMFSLLMQVLGYDFKTLAKEIDILIGNTQDYHAPVVRRRDYVAELYQMWRELKGIKGTSVNRYLNLRGIYKLPPRALKMRGDDKESQMIAVATDDAGTPKMTHTTFLHGDHKAKIDTPKKWGKVDKDNESSSQESIAIRLFDVQSCLAIAEGIESALSAHCLYEVACWSVLSTSVMKNFRAPTGVSHLMIFADADNNGAGLAAAFACGHSNIVAKNDVLKVTIKHAESGDFNDVLQETQKIHEWVLTK